MKRATVAAPACAAAADVPKTAEATAAQGLGAQSKSSREDFLGGIVAHGKKIIEDADVALMTRASKVSVETTQQELNEFANHAFLRKRTLLTVTGGPTTSGGAQVGPTFVPHSIVDPPADYWQISDETMLTR